MTRLLSSLDVQDARSLTGVFKVSRKISASLRDRREQGNHRKATEAYIQLLLTVVEQQPAELGYEFGRWTGARLAAHLARGNCDSVEWHSVASDSAAKKVCLPVGKVQSRGQARTQPPSSIQAEVSETTSSNQC